VPAPNPPGARPITATPRRGDGWKGGPEPDRLPVLVKASAGEAARHAHRAPAGEHRRRIVSDKREATAAFGDDRNVDREFVKSPPTSR